MLTNAQEDVEHHNMQTTQQNSPTSTSNDKNISFKTNWKGC